VPATTLSCMGAGAFLGLVRISDGKLLSRVESVVGSKQFDSDIKRMDPSAIKWVPGTSWYKLLGIPYKVSEDVASGLANVWVRRADKR